MVRIEWFYAVALAQRSGSSQPTLIEFSYLVNAGKSANLNSRISQHSLGRLVNLVFPISTPLTRRPETVRD